MKRAVASSLIAICVVIAVSNPTGNAVPKISYYQQRMYIQQSSVINNITEALGVSNIIVSLHECDIAICSCEWAHIQCFFLFMQDALNDILTEARKEIGANLKTALFDHLTFCTSRSTASFRLENLMIEFDKNHIHSQQTPL